MGWISNLVGAVSRGISSAVSTVKNVASKVWEKTKEVAAKAVGWMAEKAETFVGNVKKVWETVRPFIDSHIRPMIKVAADAVTHPWLKGALLALDRGLGYVANFDRTPFAKKLDDAIKWAIQAAKNLKETILSEAEVAVAEERREVFAEAAVQMSPQEGRAIQLAAMINDFVMVQSAIKKVLESNTIQDFEHYLRLRATQKLLKLTEQVLNRAADVEEITDDDIFLLKAGAGLLAANPTLSDSDAQHLDRIILVRAGKKLIPFVFEEMVMAWGQNLKRLDTECSTYSTALSKNTVLLRRLEMAKKLSDITVEEEVMLGQLRDETTSLNAQVDRLSKENREMRNYVYAAEGFLQTLEKSQEELEAEGRDYLAEEGGQVGMIIIECAQNGREWETLTKDEQMLIIDYANIFKAESEARSQQLVEVEVGA